MANDGGTIRYSPTSAPAARVGGAAKLQTLYGALSDFRYRSLEADVDYEPGGVALLRTRISGHNPDWNRGRPVELSLNVEENLISLLTSLRATRMVEDRITRRVEQRRGAQQ